MIAFEFEQLQATEKPLGLTVAKYGSAERAFVTCEGQIRYRYDGGDPDQAVGHFLSDGYIVLNGIQQIQSFKFVGTGILSISYERQ